MSTENQDDTADRKPSTKKLSKLSPKKEKPVASSQKIVEQVPDWLRILLGKYGETEGPLTGLHEDEEASFLDEMGPHCQNQKICLFPRRKPKRWLNSHLC